MALLLIYYNPNTNSFYISIVNSMIFDKKVGFENSYSHLLSQILLPYNNKLISCNSYWDYISTPRTTTRKNKVINYIISLLNKLKD